VFIAPFQQSSVGLNISCTTPTAWCDGRCNSSVYQADSGRGQLGRSKLTVQAQWADTYPITLKLQKQLLSLGQVVTHWKTKKGKSHYATYLKHQYMFLYLHNSVVFELLYVNIIIDLCIVLTYLLVMWRVCWIVLPVLWMFLYACVISSFVRVLW